MMLMTMWSEGSTFTTVGLPYCDMKESFVSREMSQNGELRERNCFGIVIAFMIDMECSRLAALPVWVVQI